MAKKTVAELWEDIFYDFDIINDINKYGFFKITADAIRSYKEPRLMTKFDYSKQLPKIFKDNKLGILPIKNGEYIIGYYDLFENISGTKYEDVSPIKKTLPDFIETIDPDNIYSESNALNVALLSGMIEDCVGEKVVETIQGKMRANAFDFFIDGCNGVNKIIIEKPAMEIDGGYEGEKNVVLVEAKNYLPDDFIIRQLYYPYRHWCEKVRKKVTPVFFGYENGVYNFFIYEFEDKNKYNSLNLIDIKRYLISSESSDEIKKRIFDNLELVEETPQNVIPFPQADSFTKIIGLLEFVEDDFDVHTITDLYEFDIRQGSYYITAAKYLGLVYGNRGSYNLTPLGKSILDLDLKSRNEKLIELILRHKVFYFSYKHYLENGEIPDKKFIIDLMRKFTDIPEESCEVFNRRSSTVRGWLEWIIGAQV